MDKMTLGWEEWLALPKLGLPAIKAKVDTGAQTSSLHAFSIELFGRANRKLVRFGVHPIPERPEFEVFCSAELVGCREVISSNGESELRYVIETPCIIGGREKPIQITLTDRGNMQYRMLLGRQALDETMVVEPSRSFCQGELSYDAYKDLPANGNVKRSLRIALLSRDVNRYSTRRMVEAAEQRDHVVEVIDTARCYMSLDAGAPNVHYQGKALPKYDAVIPRISTNLTFYGLAVVRQFEMMGTYCLNSSNAIACSRDKLYAHQLLARGGVGMPATAIAHSSIDSERIINLVGGPPLVVKLLESTHGDGVVLAENQKSAESVIGAFEGLNANFLVQQFVGESQGSDIRCLVVGGKVVAAMQRKAKEGEFRSNLHRGGTAEQIKITKDERKLAILAARLLGLNVAGVDILRSSDGPKVIEVNSSPGLEGIEAVSKKDIAAAIVEYVEVNARPVLPRLRASA